MKTTTNIEKSKAISNAIFSHQPRRLLRLLQSNVKESKEIVRTLIPDPLVYLVRQFIQNNSPEFREVLMLLIVIMTSYDSVVHDAKAEFEIFKNKSPEDVKNYCEVMNSGLMHSLNVECSDSKTNTYPSLIPFFSFTQDSKSFYKSHLRALGKKKLSEIDKSYQIYNVFIDVFHSPTSTLTTLEVFIQQINRYLNNSYNWTNETVLYPFLSECACESHTFNRKINHRRQDLERAITKQISQVYPPNEMKHLLILSVGSGKLLQDFILTSKLMLQGYKNINLYLVEPENNRNALIQLKSLVIFAANNGIQLSITHFNNFQELTDSAPHIRFNLIHAIDFDAARNAFDDLMKAHRLLANEGRLYLSFHEYDICLTSQGYDLNKLHDHYTDIEKNALEFFSKEVELQKTSPTLSYASFGHSDFFEWTQFIPYLANTESKEIFFSFLQPKVKSYFRSPTDENNVHITENDLGQFLRLFLPRKNIHVKFFNSLSNYPPELDYDFITGISCYPNNENEKKILKKAASQNAFREIFTESTQIKCNRISNIIIQYSDFFNDSAIIDLHPTPNAVQRVNKTPQSRWCKLFTPKFIAAASLLGVATQLAISRYLSY